MQLKTGARLRSMVDTTEVIVVKAPADEVDLRCGGQPMVAMTDSDGGESAPEPGFDQGTQVGKRYADETVGLELLCTKAGAGSLSLAADLLEIKGAKPLPSSD